jgi:hypothetical protein
MLAPAHADRRQLRDLAATTPTTRPPLLELKPVTAATTPLRIVIDDLVHLIRRPQLTAGAAVPGLPTLFTPLTVFAHQLLRLRPRFRAPQRPRLGRIG